MLDGHFCIQKARLGADFCPTFLSEPQIGRTADYMITTQHSLLIRLRSREDAEAWGRFVRIYTPLIYHWVKGLGVESNQSEDLVQEVFALLLGKISTIAQDPPKSFRAWLRTVTVNKCRDLFRKKEQKREPGLLEKLDDLESDTATEVDEAEYRNFVSKSALRLMQNLFSEITWKACWANVVEAKPAKVVGEELGISENAVYLARGRVLKRLREELDGLWE